MPKTRKLPERPWRESCYVMCRMARTKASSRKKVKKTTKGSVKDSETKAAPLSPVVAVPKVVPLRVSPPCVFHHAVVSLSQLRWSFQSTRPARDKTRLRTREITKQFNGWCAKWKNLRNASQNSPNVESSGSSRSSMSSPSPAKPSVMATAFIKSMTTFFRSWLLLIRFYPQFRNMVRYPLSSRAPGSFHWRKAKQS